MSEPRKKPEILNTAELPAHVCDAIHEAYTHLEPLTAPELGEAFTVLADWLGLTPPSTMRRDTPARGQSAPARPRSLPA
jgi:hypothetical protein